MYYNIILVYIIILFLSINIRCTPIPPPGTECKSCHGGCHLDEKKISKDSNGVVKGKIDSIKKDNNNRTISRNKRESTIERRACVSLFHVELFVIPLSIAMIPIALCSLLFCACYCGPKETRGKLPEKMWGIKLSKEKKDIKKRPSVVDSIADSIYEYQENYCRRVDSKKTRFNTSVVVIETRRISEAEISLPPLSPKHISPNFNECVAKYLNSLSDENKKNECRNSSEKNVEKVTRFSNNIEILGFNGVDKNESIKDENCKI
uniref:Uncharacterized protein n=1 Tax=Strongyloides venezuelensis TaxID=75913 RepID=A0A0K0FJ37_STRVS